MLANDPLPSSATLRAMLVPGVAVALARAELVDQALFPEEIAYLAGAGERRRADFGTARICARRALAELGHRPAPLVPHGDRAPRWPEGIRGSIAHGGGICIAAVGTCPPIRGIGIDVEADRPLDPSLEPAIAAPDERAWLARRPAAERGGDLLALFCAKEAVYKCQYPLTGAVLDFGDIALSIDAEQGRFTVAATRRSSPAADLLTGIEGRFRREAGLLIAAALLV